MTVLDRTTPRELTAPSVTEARTGTPELIKRNTLWIALCQMFGGAGVNLTFALGPLMVVALTGSAALAGLSVALYSLSRFVGAYPMGRVTDRYGRRPGLLIALAVALIGTLTLGVSMNAHSFPAFAAGVLIFGVGSNGVQQLRLAAAEMYPPERRATIVGLVLSGSLLGVLISPTLVGASEQVANRFGLEQLSVPWLLLPVLILPAMVMMSQVRPDPRDIAANLQRYFPGYRAPDAEAPTALGGFGLRQFLADPSRRLSGVAMFSAQGAMQTAMVTAPLTLAHHGAALPLIALSLAIHSAGMFAPSVPIGKLTDLVGRRTVLVAGTVVEVAGSVVTAFSSDHALITLGVFLVGLGWCAANVASTAIVVDSAPTAHRGRAIGALDSLAASSGLIFSLAAGPLADAAGLGSTGVMATLLLAVPAVLLLRPGSLRLAPRAA